MMLRDLYPKRYATGEDLKGKPAKVTIASVIVEKMRPNPQTEIEKPVVYFEGCKKGVVLSRTLAMQIASILKTEETDEWQGKQIVIYPTPLTVGGQQRTAIRARAA